MYLAGKAQNLSNEERAEENPKSTERSSNLRASTYCTLIGQKRRHIIVSAKSQNSRKIELGDEDIPKERRESGWIQEPMPLLG